MEDLKQLSGTEIITNNLDKIIDAFCMFYGEEKREEITKKFSNVLFLKIVSPYTIKRTIQTLKMDVLKESFNYNGFLFYEMVENAIAFINDFNEENFNMLYDDTKTVLFGRTNISFEEASRVFISQDFINKVNTFFKKYNNLLEQLKDLEELSSTIEKEQNNKNKEYYDLLIKEFSHLIPKDELDVYFQSGVIGTVMNSFLGDEIDDYSHPFDEESEKIINSPNASEIEKRHIIEDRLDFLSINGYDYETYEECLEDENCNHFIIKCKKECEKITKRKCELFENMYLYFAKKYGNFDENYRKIVQMGYMFDLNDSFREKYRSSVTPCAMSNYVLVDNEYVFTPFIMLDFSSLFGLDNTLIHELNHVYESQVISISSDGFVETSGFDKLDINVSNSSLDDEEAYKRKNEILSEYINERISLEITSYLHNSGNYIFSDSLSSEDCDYMQVGVLVEDFYQEFKDIILKSRLHGNISYIYECLGRENFDEFGELVNDFFIKSCITGFGVDLYSEGFENADRKHQEIVDEYIARKNIIMDKMRYNYSLQTKQSL